MAAACGILSSALLEGVCLPDKFASVLTAALPGVTCLSVSIAHGAPDFLRPIAILEAGSVPLLRLLPGIPNREGSATWQAYATSTVITGKAHSSKVLEQEDWARLHTKFGACTFVSAPLEAAGGVLGAVTVAGGRCCEEVAGHGGGGGKRDHGPCVAEATVCWFAQLLAESLVRRNCELLLQEALAAAGDHSALDAVAERQPRTRPLPGDPSRNALDLRFHEAVSPPSGPRSTLMRSNSLRSTSNSLRSNSSPRGGRGAEDLMAPSRRSSLVDGQELTFFCKSCRAENVMDLPYWHWGQMVDQLCARGGASSSDLDKEAPLGARGAATTRSATAPSAPQAAGAFATAGRMARLAALYGGAPDAVGNGPPASFDELRVQSTADLSHPRAARMLSGDLDASLAEAATSSSSPDPSPADSESSDLRSAVRRIYLGPPGEASSEARSASPPQAAGSPGSARPPLAQPAGASLRRQSALTPPVAHSSGAADIPADTTRLASGTGGLATVSEHSESPQHGSSRRSPAGGSPPPGAGTGPRAGAAAATAGLVVQPPGTFSTAQSPFARMVASHAAARSTAGGPPAPDPRNMYNSALEALRAKVMGPLPLAVQSEPVQPRQPAAFVKGSKEDAADAVATYTAAMKARSAAAAIGRTSPLRPKVEGALAGDGLRSVTLRSPSRSTWSSDLRTGSIIGGSPPPVSAAASTAAPTGRPANPAVAAVDSYVESLRRTSERLRSDNVSDAGRAAAAAVRATAAAAVAPAMAQPEAEAEPDVPSPHAAAVPSPVLSSPSTDAVPQSTDAAIVGVGPTEAAPADGSKDAASAGGADADVGGTVQQLQVNTQVESYIESLRRRSKVRLRTTNSTSSGSPPVSRWSRGSGSAHSASSLSGGSALAGLSEAAASAVAAAAAASATAGTQASPQQPAAAAVGSLRSASLRAPSVVLPVPAMSPVDGMAVVAPTAVHSVGGTAADELTDPSAPPQQLLPTCEAVSAVSSYLSSLRGLSQRGVSSGHMGGLLAASRPNPSSGASVKSEVPLLPSAAGRPQGTDALPRAQTTPEAAATAAVGGYLASLRSQSQMRAPRPPPLRPTLSVSTAGGASPLQPALPPVQLPEDELAAKAAKAAAMLYAGEDDDEDDDQGIDPGSYGASGAATGAKAAADTDAEAADQRGDDDDLRTGSLACLSLMNDPAAAADFDKAAAAATANVQAARSQLGLRSTSSPVGLSAPEPFTLLQSQTSRRSVDLSTAGFGRSGDLAAAMTAKSSGGSSGDAANRGDSDASAARFKLGFSPFTAMAEAASKSSSASSDSARASSRDTDNAQDAVAAYMLALRHSSADRPQGQNGENEDDGEGLRIDTPNQPAPPPRNGVTAASTGSSFFGRSSRMTASLDRMDENSEGSTDGPEAAAVAVASYMASLKQKAVKAAAASRAAGGTVAVGAAHALLDSAASAESVGASSVPQPQQPRTLSIAAVRLLKSASAVPAGSSSGEMGSGELPCSRADAAPAPSPDAAPSVHPSTSSGASSWSAAATGPSTGFSSVGSSRVPSAAAGAPAPSAAGHMLPGLPAAPDQRVLQGLDTLGRIGVSPPPALSTDDQQSLKGLTAVSEYLGDLRLRSVNLAMSRVGSRQNLSSTAAAFMDLAAEQEVHIQANQGLDQARPRTSGEWARVSDPLPSALLAVPEAADAAAATGGQPAELTRRGSS